MKIIKVFTVMIVVVMAGGGMILNAQEPLPDDAITGNNDFAFDLYQAIPKAEQENIFFSPYSISEALAMVYAGAAGNTATQMRDTLHFSGDVHPAFQAIRKYLANRPPTERGDPLQLHVANSLWGQQGYAFKDDFLQMLRDHYGAGLEQVDFQTDPEGVRQQVNAWVADNTADKIQNIVPEGAINSLTRLVLANAIYFKGSWRFPFEESYTQDAPFTLLDGSTVDVPMMFQSEDMGYVDNREAGYQAVSLQYADRRAGMLIILPDSGQDAGHPAGQFAAVENSLNSARVRDLLSQIEEQDIHLYMPRFEYEFSVNLSDTLKVMGMSDAFDASLADFSGMSDTTVEPLYISDVLHKAFVKVDEAGTEAAAATVVMMETTAMPMGEPLEVRLDRPFIFLIYDQSSGGGNPIILFMGRVMNPIQ